MSPATLLVANRGEIARRVFRSARELGMRCTAVYVDADAGAPFVAEADEAARLPNRGYLDADAILEAARALGATAIHPGYGFLSENAGFARRVQDAGLMWVGPAPDAIERMGDKLAAKALAREVGVPILPGSDDPAQAEAVGYPLLVKAAAGGGGKGMRVVDGPGGLDAALAHARREAEASFGDPRVFVERYVKRARHVEIQLLGDQHGNLVHLGERECSIQRRHQKIVEEAPSPRLDAPLREAMADAALRLGRALGYASTGTVEFLLDDDSGEFFFLEVNTRLQVEHPVTEAITGIDLVREQLRIAAGEALGYGQDAVRFAGHAIEARLYAEDPARGFLPATGTLAAFEPAQSPAVRWDAGVTTGSLVGTDFDPMLAKVIAAAETRSEAAARLALALERTHLAGVVTNRDFLVSTLRAPAFLAGDTTTDFIERVTPATSPALEPGERERLARVAALWLQGENRAAAGVLGSLPSGFLVGRLPDQRVVLAHGDEELTVSYRRLRDGRFRFGADQHARVHAVDATHVDVELSGRRRRHRVTRAGERLVVQGVAGDVSFELRPRFTLPGQQETAGGLLSPMPGKVIELLAAPGQRVTAGEKLVVLEAMKMEHALTAPEDGVVSEVRVAVGEQVDSRAVLLVIDGDGAGQERMAEDGDLAGRGAPDGLAPREEGSRAPSPGRASGPTKEHP